MFNAIKKLLGLNKANAWLAEQRTQLHAYLTEELGSTAGVGREPAWTFAPYVAIWKIDGGWAITDSIVALHVVGNAGSVLKGPRDAARYFGRRFRDSATTAANENADVAEALDARATALLSSVELDSEWRDPPRTVATAIEQQAFSVLRDIQSETPPGLHVLHVETTAPGGPFHALYPCLHVRPGQPLEPLFDQLARVLADIEDRVAPLLAWRLYYALVVFGINFGEAARELEVEREADAMLARHPGLAETLNRYAAKGQFPLAMHLVNDKDVPFTAHPVAPRPDHHEYKAEAEYFNIQEHPFNKSLEESDTVGMRIVAASINAKTIAKARKGLRK